MATPRPGAPPKNPKNVIFRFQELFSKIRFFMFMCLIFLHKIIMRGTRQTLESARTQKLKKLLFWRIVGVPGKYSGNCQTPLPGRIFRDFPGTRRLLENYFKTIQKLLPESPGVVFE